MMRRLSQKLEHYKKEFEKKWNRTRNIWNCRRFSELDLSAYVAPKAIFFGSEGISISSDVLIFPYATINCTSWRDINKSAGAISIGRGTAIQPFAFLHSDGGRIIIGQYCSINPYALLYGQGGLNIGNYVRIASHVVIVPSNHIYDNIELPIVKQGSTQLGINIEDDVWIGTGARILDGVTIGKGCVIGAGSVVTKSTEPYGVYVGIPARKIKSRI